ncbi:protein translocase subunit SecD [Pleionea sp. CnH1-48]|uniref:protein translocase subunit SecD n=1 Tax=Pleionea sp. CnH1-48 TaxID=2954494 RepID=UPI002097906F|nr:protein translocase subunit SecD [Pleionea sp. CnH1-48]MCO7222863.1 protein translocase subunit SecD [Pleionea sp. CnH1-48]
MLLGQPRQMPLNTYQGWKYFLIVFVIGLGMLLALPNLFGEDFALQISNKKGTPVAEELVDNITKKLEAEGVKPFKSEVVDGRGLIRFNDQDEQSAAKKIAFQFIKNNEDENLKNEIVVAINLAPATPDWLRDLGLNPMKRGLDLRGGVHFLIEVDTDDLFEKEQEKVISDIKAALFEAGKIYHEGVNALNSKTVIAKFKSEEIRDQAFAAVNNRMTGYKIDDREANDLFNLHFTILPAKEQEIRNYAIDQNINILRNRINALGVAEPVIQREGAERIGVQLPGVQDSTTARTIIGDTRTIEFRLVNDKRRVEDVVASGRTPRDSELLFEGGARPWLILKKAILDGEHITGASTSADETGMPQINVRLDGAGGKKMSKETAKNIGRPMAIVLTDVSPIYKTDESGDYIKDEHGQLTVIDKKIDKEVVSAPVIQSQLGSQFRITGQFTQQEASNLALLLKAGSLKAPISIVEERTIGPSLGKENIRLGLESILIGFVLVLAFMLVRYKFFGFVANIALLLNLVLIVGMMSMIGAVLTLPGMAGIVLTVGMAVDANVLIFERIREELAEGVSPAQAIHNGYDRAFSTIADANITTMIAALILFAIGTGPVAGFAITLFFGILTSMFTAIMVSRAITNSIYGGKPVKKLMI